MSSRPLSLRLSTKLLSFILIFCFLFMLGLWESNQRSIVTLALFALCLAFMVLSALILFIPIKRLERIFSSYRSGDSAQYYNVAQMDQAFQAILSRQANLLKNEHEAEILRKDTELSALISQINPHFLYNTLDSIRGYSILHNIIEIADLTESLSILFRNVISNNSEYISLEDELKNIDCYMSIQNFRFNNKFHLVSRIEDKGLLQCQILNLTLQPIVENSITHGLESKVGDCDIVISVMKTEKRIIMMVSDNGIGIESEKTNMLNDAFISPQDQKILSHDNHNSIALLNINQRIKLLFGENYGLKVLSTIGVGTDVEIILPVIMGGADHA
jgi:two-component system sensor histidine kinase YesM